MGSPDASILIVLDADTPSNRAALAAPIGFLDPEQVAVLSPGRSPVGPPPGPGTVPVRSRTELHRALPGLGAVVSAGGYLPLSALAHDLARARRIPTFVVQHGALTPFSPPLPPDTTLCAWTESDGTFWQSGRDDVQVEVTGSQLLASVEPVAPDRIDPAERPTFLGQLHGRELPWSEVFTTAKRFCRGTGARYRPHPAEVDKVSRVGHGLLRAAGIEFVPGGEPLGRIGTPVVAMFSSGILEAAAAGVPAWGHHPDPPPWLVGFWDRYGIAPWGHDPSPPPSRPATEPAERIARIVTASIGPTP